MKKPCGRHQLSVCPYLRSEWLEVRMRTGMSERETVKIWRRRVRAALKAGLYVQVAPRRVYRSDRFIDSGIDNSYQSEDAHRLLLMIAIRKHAADVANGRKPALREPSAKPSRKVA